MRIYLATWAEDNQGEGLSSIGYRHRLMSFFFLEKERKNFIQNYVRDGNASRIKEGETIENSKRSSS